MAITGTNGQTQSPEVPCSVHHKSKYMQNMQIEKNIEHILHILPEA
jgi:hypothetical protein